MASRFKTPPELPLPVADSPFNAAEVPEHVPEKPFNKRGFTPSTGPGNDQEYAVVVAEAFHPAPEAILTVLGQGKGEGVIQRPAPETVEQYPAKLPGAGGTFGWGPKNLHGHTGRTAKGAVPLGPLLGFEKGIEGVPGVFGEFGDFFLCAGFCSAA
jgi:hypothetical protein